MTRFEGTPEDMLKVLPKQLGATVHYHVTLEGATRIVEKQASSTRADVMARTLAGKMFDQSNLPIHALTKAIGLLTEEQLDLIQQADRAVERFTKSSAYIRALKDTLMMGRFSHFATPHEYLIAWVADNFNEKALRHIVDYADISFSLPITVMTCFALENAGVEVNERTVTHHISFIQLLHNGSLGWSRAESNMSLYGKEAVKVIHEYPERLEDIVDYYKDRGETLLGIREYLLSEKALASGVL